MYLKGYSSAVNAKTHAAIATIHLGHRSHLKETLSLPVLPIEACFLLSISLHDCESFNFVACETSDFPDF